MKKTQKFIVGLIVAGLVFGFAITSIGQNETPQSQVTQSVQTNANQIQLVGEDGKNVLELLKKDHQVEFTESANGALINSIDGVNGTDKEFWLYDINGKPGEVAADKAITKNGDTITWKYQGF